MVRDCSKRDIFLEFFAVLGILLEKNWDLKTVVEILIIQGLGQMNCEERLIRHGLFLGKGSAKGGPHRALEDPERNVLMSVSSLR